MTNSCSKEWIILYKLHFLNKEISSKLEGCTGLSQSRIEILYQLYQFEEISQKDLQKEVSLDAAAITRHLKYFEANEMIVRRKNPLDNRITLVSLTDDGRSKIRSFEAEKERFASSILRGFTGKERDELLHILDRIAKNINEV